MEFDDSSDEKQADSEMANNDVKLNNNHSQPKQPLIMELESKEFKTSQVKKISTFLFTIFDGNL